MGDTMPLRPVLNIAVCLALGTAFAVQCRGGRAGQVTLVLRTGGLTMMGELLQSNKGSYVIKSDKFGVVSVEAAKFECSGAACPKVPASTVGIHGSNTIGAQLMPNTIERFADKEGYTVEKIVGADPEAVQYKLYTNDGKTAGLIDLQSHGSNTAPADLQKGKAQVGMMSRPIKPEEVKAIAKAAGPSLPPTSLPWTASPFWSRRRTR